MKLSLLLAISIVSLYISSCVATQDDVGGLYARQNRLEAKVDRLSKRMRSNFIGTVSGGDSEINDQVFQLETKVYDLEQKISMLENQIDYLEGNLQGEGVRPAPPPNAPHVATASPPGYRIPPSPSRENVPQQTQQQEQQQVEAVEEITQFDVAYQEFTQGNYAKSRQNFRVFLQEDPKSSKAPDATFWIADSYYREGLYEEAILEYQSLIDIYPRDSRVPLAYLKQGLSLMKLNKNEEAKLFLQTLID